MAMPKLPPGTNPLAKALATKLLAARKQVGLSRKAFAERSALPISVLEDIEGARYVPAPWVLARIEGVVNGSTFGKSSPAVPRPSVRDAKGWHAYRARLSPAVADRVRRISAAMGCTAEELIIMAVEHFLDTPGVLATFEETARRINRGRMISALGDSPLYRQFLKMDLDLCRELGAEVEQSGGDRQVSANDRRQGSDSNDGQLFAQQGARYDVEDV